MTTADAQAFAAALTRALPAMPVVDALPPENTLVVGFPTRNATMTLKRAAEPNLSTIDLTGAELTEWMPSPEALPRPALGDFLIAYLDGAWQTMCALESTATGIRVLKPQTSLAAHERFSGPRRARLEAVIRLCLSGGISIS